MYQLQQPWRLENLAVQALARSIGIQMKKIIPAIIELGERDANEAHNLLSRHIEVIRHRLQCNVHKTLYDMLAVETIEAFAILCEDPEFCKKIDLCKSWYKPYEEMKELLYLGRMIETVFTQHLTRLTIDTRCINEVLADMFIPSICNFPHLFKGLVRLDLVLNIKRSVYSQWTKHIIPVLKELGNLKHISLESSFCSLDVLQCLVDCCKNIEELQFISVGSSIIKSTHESMAPLSQLSKLRYFHCEGIWFPYKDITQELLLSCENIEHIDIKQVKYDTFKYPQEDNIGGALMNIISSNHEEKKRMKKAEKNFKLKYYANNIKTTHESMELVMQMCPLIEEMRLKRQNLDALRTLKNFELIPNLSKLKLYDYHFYGNNINDVLLVRGLHLVELCLDDVHGIDLNALIHINKTCPNLECLHINNAGFMSFEGHIYSFEEIIELNNPSFINLKTLSLSGSSITRPLTYDVIDPLIFFLLLKSPNIEFVTFGHFGGVILIDPIVEKVVEKNPLKYVKQLRLQSVYSALSTLVIDHLVQNCVEPAEVIKRSSRHKYYFARS